MKGKIKTDLSKTLIALCFITVLVANVVAEPIWVEDFRAFDQSKYHIEGDAYWDENNNYFVLTKSEPNQTGRIFFTRPVEMHAWAAEFEIRIWEGGGLNGGADGLTFAFVRSYDYIGQGGTYLDFGGEGYGVEFDTYPFENPGDPQEHHIGLLEYDVYNHLTTAVIPGGLRDNSWRHIRIVFTSGQITVYYDGKEVISNYSIPDYAVFTGYFGFTAATGGGYEWHAVRNIRISQMLQFDHDVMIGSITAPGEVVEPTKPVTPAVKLRNIGKNDEANFTVAFEITAARKTVYSETQTVESLASLKSQDVRFTEWTPQAVEQYEVKVTVTLPSDENPDNNSLTSTVTPLRFTDVTEAVGLSDENGGSCVAVGDYYGDENLDIYTGHLYRNKGDGTFEDVMDVAGLQRFTDSISAVFGDVDGDDDLELLVINPQALALYRNNGDGTFTEMTKEAGIQSEGGFRKVILADYDGDGSLDIYIASIGKNRLYHNNGDGTFQDVTESAGVGDACWSESAAFGDYDGNGKLDLCIANWGDANALYRNNGDGTFTDVTETAGVGHAGSAKAVAWLDYDADGKNDLFVVNSYQQPDVLYRNNGDGTFTDVTQTAGLDDETWGEAVSLGDYDSDGDIDIYLIASSGGNVLYANNGDGTFSVATKVAGAGSIGENVDAVFVDIDRDGVLDLYVVKKGGQNTIYRNSAKQNK